MAANGWPQELWKKQELNKQAKQVQLHEKAKLCAQFLNFEKSGVKGE